MSEEEQQPAASDPSASVASWERPWSLEELRYATDEWTLASDAGLLLHLKSFSENLIQKTKEVGGEMDQLVLSVKTADVAVRNTFNEFMMLSHKQFVENRVYDEDVTETTEAPPEEGEEELNYSQMESILVPKYQDAIGNGLAVLQQTLSMRNEFDFEPEDTKLDEYSKYPLPFVIGTKQFKENDFCGLFVPEEIEDGFSDLELEDEPAEGTSEPSVGGINLEKDSDDDFGEFEEEDEENYSEEDKREESEDHEYSEEAEDSEAKFDIKEQGVKIFPDKISVNLKKAPLDDPTGWSEGDDEYAAPASASSGLFDQEGGLFGEKNESEEEEGLFGDDEEPLFENKPKPTPKDNAKKMGISVFPMLEDVDKDEVEDDGELPPPPDVGSDQEEDSTEIVEEKKPKFGQQVLPTGILSGLSSVKLKGSNTADAGSLLFDENEEGDLFSSDSSSLFSAPKEEEPKKKEGKRESEKQSVAAPVAASSLFDEGDDDSFFSLSSTPKKTTATKTPSSSVGATSSTKSISLFDEGEEDSLFGDLGKKSSTTKSKTTAKPTASLSSFGGDLFGDDEDDLFSSLSSSKKDSTPKKENAAKKKEEPSLSVDDDFFSAPAPKKKEEPKVSEDFLDLPAVAPKKEDTNKTSSVDDDFFGLPPKKDDPVPTSSVDDDFFGSPPPKKDSEKAPSTAKKQEPTSSSVDADLFGPPPAKKENPTRVSSVDDDFFGSPPAKKDTTKVSSTSEKQEPTTSSVDEDLLGSRSENTTKAPKKPDTKSNTFEDFLFGSNSPKQDKVEAVAAPKEDFLDLPVSDKTEDVEIETPPPNLRSTSAPKSKSGSKISQLQQNLNLNVNKLLPGAGASAKKKELRDPDSISFDDSEISGPPPKLEHLTKARPTMATKARRRPSRKPLSSRLSTASSPAALAVKTSEESKEEKTERKEYSIPNGTEPPKVDVKKAVPSHEEPRQVKPVANEDIFGDFEDELFKAPSKPTKSSGFDVDDLLGGPSQAKETPTMDLPVSKAATESKTTVPKRASTKATDFDFDDIFSASTKSGTTTPKKTATPRVSVPKTTSSTTKDTTATGLPDGIFDDPAKKKVVKRVVKTVKKTPTTKAANTKPTKTKSSAANDLDDLFDDIF